MLYVVSTPIGNLDDITLRAVQVLRSCDLVAAEDTRRTRKIFMIFHIKNKLISYNDHNKKRRTPELIKLLKEGKTVVVVSDAGTPSISDPGFYLVREAIKNDIKVVPVPGASALLAALSCSGLATDRFTFYGFLPKKEGKKSKLIKEIKERNETAILFESPHRIKKTMESIAEELPEKEVVIARELTKMHEEFIRGNVKEVNKKIQKKQIKGEIVLIIN